jgi:hypothetical protein
MNLQEYARILPVLPYKPPVFEGLRLWDINVKLSPTECLPAGVKDLKMSFEI